MKKLQIIANQQHTINLQSIAIAAIQQKHDSLRDHLQVLVEKYNKLHTEHRGLSEKLTDTAKAMKELDSQNNRLTHENALLRQEDDDSIQTIVDLRKELSMTQRALLVIKANTESIRVCRHAVGQDDKPTCGCSLSTCAYDHPGAKNELPF